MLGPVEDLLARSRHRPVARRQRSQLEVVNRNGLRLLRLVNTLLDFSRIEAGRVRAVYEPTDLAAFTADLASNFRSAVREGRAATVGGLPAAGRAGVRGPGDVGEGRPQPPLQRLQVHLRRRDRRLPAAGRAMPPNCGCGTPARASPPRRCPGCSSASTGSRTHGAAPTKAAASAWRWCRSWSSCTAAPSPPRASSAQGTTFTVTVPLGSAHLPPDQIGDGRSLASTGDGGQPLTSRRRCGGSPTTHGTRTKAAPNCRPTHEPLPTPYRRPQPDEADRPRVLVADDNADMRQYVARLLAEQYRVEAVPDGEAALAAARRRRPDLILTDVMMPRLDGFGLLRELRADPRTGGVPVILLSARAGEESRVEGMEAGADDYLVKPFGARELLARVSAHLQMARLRRESERAVRESEERFRAFVSASSDVVYRMSADWSEMRLPARPGVHRRHARAEPHLAAEVHPPGRPAAGHESHRGGHSHHGAYFELEHRVVRLDGTVGWTFSRAVPLAGRGRRSRRVVRCGQRRHRTASGPRNRPTSSRSSFADWPRSPPG